MLDHDRRTVGSGPCPAAYDLVTRTTSTALLAGWGEPRYRADQVWDGLHRRLARPDELTDLPEALRTRLAEALPRRCEPRSPRTERRRRDLSGCGASTTARTVETVLMRYPDRDTVCVSTQAGCAMACGFCATGQAGFERHLTAGEIVEQVVARRPPGPRRGPAPRQRRVHGHGRAARQLRRHVGRRRAHPRRPRALGARHLTLSTVGIVPGIRRLADERLPVNLAVSLHAANDELRDELVPINRRYPLADLVAACADYLDAKGRRLSLRVGAHRRRQRHAPSRRRRPRRALPALRSAPT